VRRPIDYNSTIIRYLEERYFRKDKWLNLLLEPDENFIINVIDSFFFTLNRIQALYLFLFWGLDDASMCTPASTYQLCDH
jgi:hypothetical protein